MDEPGRRGLRGDARPCDRRHPCRRRPAALDPCGRLVGGSHSREGTMKRRDLLIGSSVLAGGSRIPATRRGALAQARPTQMVIMTLGFLWGVSVRDGDGNAFEKDP